MRKTVIFLLILCLVFALVGCAAKDGTPSDNESGSITGDNKVENAVDDVVGGAHDAADDVLDGAQGAVDGAVGGAKDVVDGVARGTKDLVTGNQSNSPAA